MNEATIIYPHQLFTDSPAVKNGRPIFLVEEPLLLTHNPIHRQKLMFHKLSMDAYQRNLEAAGHTVHRLTLTDYTTTKQLLGEVANAGVETVHIVDTTDTYLERAISESGLMRVWYESPLFILEKADAVARYEKSKRFMASFYKQLRKDKHILLTKDGDPTGGAWSFDEDNRQALPKTKTLPDDIQHFGNQETNDAKDWVATVGKDVYGEAGCWLPYTHEGAHKFLEEFLCERFHDFGAYEDALTTRSTRLFHSTLSPLINVGLLTPQEVIEAALAYSDEHSVPINSLEGFIRQILGWREFLRASYECDGGSMRSKNFWKHQRTLPQSMWDGTTGIDPVDRVITTALAHGYTHHIERLMVMGNFMLLTKLHPDEVYKWFMGMYVDAYDWVMVPNVYGMSQFADGGSFATKPYISGANYIKKMSDFAGGEWESTWTALYWHFIDTHKDFFKNNYRLSMMPRLLEKMKEETRTEHMKKANEYFRTTN